MTLVLGPTFADEARSALGLQDLPFSYDEAGNIHGWETLTEDQKASLQAAISAHDPYRVPPPTLADFQAAIDAHVDAVAGQRNYSSGTSCASYAASTVPQWQGEATTFIAWRDGVWAYAYAELDRVETGQRPAPAVTDFVAELPTIVWP